MPYTPHQLKVQEAGLRMDGSALSYHCCFKCLWGGKPLYLIPDSATAPRSKNSNAPAKITGVVL